MSQPTKEFKPQFERSWENNYLFGTCVFPDVFSADECLRVIEAPAHESASSLAGEVDSPERVRNSISSYLPNTPENAWLYERLIGLIHHVNQNSFHFHIDSFEPLLRLEYQEGGHYNWHVDVGFAALSKRKLSLIVFLTDPDSFGGGELKMITGVYNQEPLSQAQGSVVIFPSYMLHQVSPVLNGTRHSLVFWANGPCFQ